MNFMRCNPRHHSLAFARGPHVSLHHVSFELRGIDEFMRGTGRVLRSGTRMVWGPGRHLAGDNTFSYFLDPQGNTIEYTTELAELDEDAWHPHVYDMHDDGGARPVGHGEPDERTGRQGVLQRPRPRAVHRPAGLRPARKCPFTIQNGCGCSSSRTRLPRPGQDRPRSCPGSLIARNNSVEGDIMRPVQPGGIAALALAAGLGLAACSSSSSSPLPQARAPRAAPPPRHARPAHRARRPQPRAAPSRPRSPTDPDGVLAALPASLQALYNGYPTGVYKSAFASWKPDVRDQQDRRLPAVGDQQRLPARAAVDPGRHAQVGRLHRGRGDLLRPGDRPGGRLQPDGREEGRR